MHVHLFYLFFMTCGQRGFWLSDNSYFYLLNSEEDQLFLWAQKLMEENFLYFLPLKITDCSLLLLKKIFALPLLYLEWLTFAI